MQTKSISRILVVTARALVVCGLLFAVSVARADDDEKCTDRTLHGDYGFAAEGVLLGTPGLPTQAQFRSLGVAHLNGRGRSNLGGAYGHQRCTSERGFYTCHWNLQC
jgi:hypothetical protein